MGANTKIEWCDHTLNLWWGCVEQGPECDHCYARTLAKRYGFKVWGTSSPRRYFGPKHLGQVIAWNRAAAKAGERKRVFVQSMGDICEIGRDEFDAARGQFFEVVEQCEALDFLLLTKLPQNFDRILPWRWKASPRPNVVGMVTCGHSSSLWRLQCLMDAPFQRRGLSMEPLLEPLTPHWAWKWDWVIVGGESGPNARPMHPDWARAARDVCAEHGVPFFFKQWGEFAPGEIAGDYLNPKRRAKGLKWFGYQWIDCWSEVDGHRDDEPDVYRIGKAKAGNLLDGRLHQEFYRPVEVAA